MKHTQKWLMFMVIAALFVMAACQNAQSEDTSSKHDQSSNQEAMDEKADEDTEEKQDVKEADQEDSTNTAAPSEHSSSDQPAAGMKEKYLKKLNKTEDEIQKMLNGSDASTTLEMEEEQTELFNRWDQELNEVYGVLKEELPEEEFAELREEQRKWITQRDEEAKNASKKYEGGTMESLEYVAVKTELTKERAYELTAKYMK
jgi:uncharacterized protein YecT (DUF1311 family)